MITIRTVLLSSSCFTLSCAPPGVPASPTPTAAPAATPAAAPAATPAAAPAALAEATSCTQKFEALPLPGATAPVSVDYLFYEPGGSRVWVPAGGSGSVDVFDIAARSFTAIEGFRTVERDAHGKKRVVGPSSGTVGDGFAYVGDRASQEVCAVDLRTLHKGSCLTLSAQPDGVVYIAQNHEVWVTAPSVKTLFVLDASAAGKLTQKSSIVLPGEPEGYAVDAARGRFLTNLEDANKTLSIDLSTREVRDTWSATCNEDGPRGVAVDSARQVALVACTDHIQALDMAHGGAPLGRLDCGLGVDNIDYDQGARLLYAAAGKAGRLTVARVEDGGTFTTRERCETVVGARNAIADAKGNVYLADAQGARLLLFRAP